MTKEKKPYELKKRLFAVVTKILSLSIMKYYKPINEDKLYIKLSIVAVMTIGTATLMYLLINGVIMLASLGIGSYLAIVIVVFVAYMIVAVDRVKLDKEPANDKESK